MADKAKGPVVLLIILLVIAVIAATLGFLGLQKEKETNALLMEKVEQLEVRKRQAEKQITDLKEQADKLKEDLALQQAKVTDLNNQLAQAGNELIQEREAKENALIEASSLKSEMDSLTAAKSSLEARLKSSQDALEGLRSQLSALESAKKGLEDKLKDSESKPKKDNAPEAKTKDMQLEKIVVAPSGSSEPPAAVDASVPPPGVSTDAPVQALVRLEGRVLVVNKEYDFIVINLGQKDNVGIGDTFEISRKDKKLGEVKVEEVRDTMSVASPVTKDMIKQIKEDDTAVRV